MAKKGSDPVDGAVTDGTYSQLSTPLNVPKASADPQADYKNDVIPHAEGHGDHYDPMGYLDLTGDRGRRGDPPKK
jgi:hypothetical protein